MPADETTGGYDETLNDNWGPWKMWAHNLKANKGVSFLDSMNPMKVSEGVSPWRGRAINFLGLMGEPGLSALTAVPWAKFAKAGYNVLKPGPSKRTIALMNEEAEARGGITDAEHYGDSQHGPDPRFAYSPEEDMGPMGDYDWDSERSTAAPWNTAQGQTNINDAMVEAARSNADVMAANGLPTDHISINSATDPNFGLDAGTPWKAQTPATEGMKSWMSEAAAGPQHAGGFLSDPNARIGGTGYDEVGAALSGRNQGAGFDNPFAGMDMSAVNKLLDWRKANPHLQPEYKGPAWEGQEFEGQRPPWLEHYWGGGSAKQGPEVQKH